jgi:hypothetical protein
MKFNVLFILIFTSVISYSQSFKVPSLFQEQQKNGTIEGVVLDKENSNEPLIFAEIKVKNTPINVESNRNGVFQMNLKPGIYTLEVQFIGYKTIEIENVEVLSNSITSIKTALQPLKIAAPVSFASAH